MMLALGYFCYYSSGSQEGGPIYFYEMMLPLFALLALTLPRLLEKLSPLSSKARFGLALACIYAASGSAIINFRPDFRTQRLTEIERREWVKAVESAPDNSIVFLPPTHYYVGHPLGNLTNNPAFSGRVLFAVRPRPEDWETTLQELKQNFPTRSICMFVIEDKRFRVEAAPDQPPARQKYIDTGYAIFGTP